MNFRLPPNPPFSPNHLIGQSNQVKLIECRLTLSWQKFQKIDKKGVVQPLWHDFVRPHHIGNQTSSHFVKLAVLEGAESMDLLGKPIVTVSPTRFVASTLK